MQDANIMRLMDLPDDWWRYRAACKDRSEIPAHALTCASGRDGVELGSASRRNVAMRKHITCLARRADIRARLEREYGPGEKIGR